MGSRRIRLRRRPRARSALGHNAWLLFACSLYHRSKEDFLIQGTFQGVERCNQFPRRVAEQMYDQMVEFWMIQ